MIRQTYQIDIITPCFCGGAEPEKHAEIRAPSIRGQLRWWFRVLGGFKSLAHLPLPKQESLIFGLTAGDEETAGKLAVRVHPRGLKSTRKDGQELGHANFTDSAFLTFPVQSREKQGIKTDYAGRGVIEGAFELTLLWRGEPSFAADLQALAVVFGNLGSLGFRARRAMGALAFQQQPPLKFSDAIVRFNTSHALDIRSLPSVSAKGAISSLGGWLKSCRAHGRSGQNRDEQDGAYFAYAKNDHDIGYDMSDTANAPAFRPALGLPIIQRTQRATNNWEWAWNVQKRKNEGRFASPVILRPHRAADGSWHALVIFVDAKKWDVSKKVYLNGTPRDVSLDLYEAMKSDPRLKPFPPA